MCPVASARNILTVESRMKDNWFTREGKRGMLPVKAWDVTGDSTGCCCWKRGMVDVAGESTGWLLMDARSLAGESAGCCR